MLVGATKITLGQKEPEQGCPDCHGTGVSDGLKCLCTIDFANVVSEEVVVDVEIVSVRAFDPNSN